MPHIRGHYIPRISSTILVLLVIGFTLYCWYVPILAILHLAPYDGPTTFSQIVAEYVLLPLLPGHPFLKAAFNNNLYEKRFLYITSYLGGIFVVGFFHIVNWLRGITELGAGMAGIGCIALVMLVIGVVVYVEELVGEEASKTNSAAGQGREDSLVKKMK